MRVAGEAIARQARIENGDLAAGTAELQGGGEAGKAAADDDDVIHGDGLRVVDDHRTFKGRFFMVKRPSDLIGNYVPIKRLVSALPESLGGLAPWQTLQFIHSSLARQ